MQKFIDKEYNLIITVDNGINAKAPIELALRNQVDVIITDHHSIDETSQTKALYIHPAYSNLDYHVSGGFVAYNLAKALLNKDDKYLHALAAITIISDVMPLVKGNRLFVREALKNINNYKFSPIYKLVNGFVDSGSIGNLIAPKINAMGRLNDLYNPNQLVKYFNSVNEQELDAFSKMIEECNNKRKLLTQSYVNKYHHLKPVDNFLMIEDNDLHEGLIGLLASRFSNEYNCICYVGALNNDHYKASIRSPKAIDIYKYINDNNDLFIKYGGHRNAVGLSYYKANSESIHQIMTDALAKYDLSKEYNVIALKAEDITIENIMSLRYFEPYGNEFERPLFLIKDAIVTKINPLKNKLHYRISILFNELNFDVMMFNVKSLEFDLSSKVDFVVNLSINDFNGKSSVNIISENYQIV